MNGPWTHRTLFAAALSFMIVFLWHISSVIGQLQDWSFVWNPPTVGKMIMAAVWAMLAFASALGIDVTKLLPQPKE